MIHLGDICKLSGDSVPLVDIVCGGSPCQDLSVAGKREGLAGARSGLFMEQIRIIKEMRDVSRERVIAGTDKHIRPRYMVWENVPGAFSSNKGEDFRAVLEETARIADEKASIPRLEGGQNGLPRVALWEMGGALLGEYTMRSFGEYPNEERESHLSQILEEHPLPKYSLSAKACQGILNRANRRGKQLPKLLEDALIRQSGGVFDVRVSSDGTKNWRAHCYETDISRALDTGGENPDSNHGGVAIIQKPYGISSFDSNAMKSPNPHSGVYEAETSRTLDNNGGNPACNQGGVAIVVDQGAGKSQCSISEDVTPTLATTHGGEPAICFTQDAFDKYSQNEQGASLLAKGGMYGG